MQCSEIAEKAADVYNTASLVETKQSAQLLSVFCGGVPCINHLLRSTASATHGQACSIVDQATTAALRAQLGVDSLTPSQERQCALPIRHGGLGYRRAADVADAAMLGGFACAAHLGYGIGDLDPTLSSVMANPDDHAGSWRRRRR